ncbi:MAG: cardiolipin synthase [Cryomorphaceae bacterium]|nr:cardiolipin synthase [Cryomorphaceae bacterium]
MLEDFLFLNIIYYIILGLVCLKIVYETNHSVKAIAYILFALLLPVFGMVFYFIFGINYRKRKIYRKKVVTDGLLRKRLGENILGKTLDRINNHPKEIGAASGLVELLFNENSSPLTDGNKVELLINGEEKFPRLLEDIARAKHHIHLQYYIFENDGIGGEIIEAISEKAKSGVEVRFIYDDFGSRDFGKKATEKLRRCGVQIFPYNKIRFGFLANRINYRNHRKSVIIDGEIAYTGGINVSDRYINQGNENFWRDTHLRLQGPGVYFLQYQFFADWNFCASQSLQMKDTYFPGKPCPGHNALVQIAAGGPDCPSPTIMLSLIKAISVAQREICITTPYFIPGESVKDAIKVAAISGIKVKLLVPEKSDSRLVNAAAYSYYNDLMAIGVEVYLYQKGFIHAKTMIIDDNLSVVGTANMDTRSFDLNFELNAVIYDRAFAAEHKLVFQEDLAHARKVDFEAWQLRPKTKLLSERLARLLSPML